MRLVVLASLGGAAVLATGLLTSEPESAVLQHLTPRLLHDGRPAVELVTGSEVLQELPIRTELDAWSVLGASWSPAAEPAKSGAVLTRGSQPGATAPGRDPIVLERAGLTWGAAELHALVLRAAFPRNGRARILFRTGEDELQQRGWQAERLDAGLPPIYSFPEENVLELELGPSEALAEHRAQPWRHPRWHGTIRALRIELDAAVLPARLESLRAERNDLPIGASPRLAAGRPLDAGLVRLDWRHPYVPAFDRAEARRAVPALAGLDQFVRIDETRDQALHLSFALPPAGRTFSEPVVFQVWRADAQDAPTAWTEGVPPGELDVGPLVLDATLEPGADAGVWRSASIDLPKDGGDILLLRTRGARSAGRLNGLWGPLTVRPAELEPPASVLLVTLEGARVDHLAAFGGDAIATPSFEQLGASGALYVDALATSDGLLPSIASILTGRHPRAHRLVGRRGTLAEDVTTLCEAMRASGRFVIASPGTRALAAARTGLGQGVDVWLDVPEAAPEVEMDAAERREWESLRAGKRDAHALNRQIDSLLRELGPRPFFLWVHYSDAVPPHPAPPDARGSGDEARLLDRLAAERASEHPGAPGATGAPDPLGGWRAPTGEELREFLVADRAHLELLLGDADERSARAGYRAALGRIDAAFGELSGIVAAAAQGADTLIALAGANGLALGERGVWFASEGLDASTLRVPLALAGPGVPEALWNDGPAQTIDLFPTLCELLDLALPEGVQGRSLLELPSRSSGITRQRWFRQADDVALGFLHDETGFTVTLRDHSEGEAGRLVPAGWAERSSVRGGSDYSASNR